MILTASGWIAAVVLLAMAGASAFYALYRRHDLGLSASLLPAPAFAALSFTVAFATGAARSIIELVLAVALAAFTVWAGRLWTPGGIRELAGDMRADIAWAAGWLLRRGGRPRAAAVPQGSPPETVAKAVTARGIPSVLEDPHLGPAVEPGEIAAGPAQAPAPYVQLAEFIAGFEPTDDMELRAFMEGNAAGSVLVADAWHAFADTCLNGVGLDPAYVAGVMEAGDSSAGHGSLLAQIHKRFGVIYAQVKEWISGHGPLPKNARDFLTGDL